VQDVMYFSKAALWDDFKQWRDGGEVCSGSFNECGIWTATLSTRTPGYQQSGQRMVGIEQAFDTAIFEGNVWGLEWFDSDLADPGAFPQYYKHVGEQRIAISPEEVPSGTGLHSKEFPLAERGEPFTSPAKGAWTSPGPVDGPHQVELIDGSLVTYAWYRFVDQPSFQQYDWSEEKKQALQMFVEQIHRHWRIDGQYMPPPTTGELVRLDPALFVTPPAGLEVGYVPIVIRQEDAGDRTGG